jgi:tRNA A-37 threonylcarbamoyl transferase component Bud32
MPAPAATAGMTPLMGQEQYYRRVHAPTGVAYGVADLPEAELLRLLKRPDALVWRHLDRPVKLSHVCVLVEAELPLAGGAIRVAYKQFRPRGWWKSLCGRFRRSPARRSWDLGRALLARGIATPRPLAGCEPRDRCLACTSYLATEWIAGGENLHLFAWRLADLQPETRLRWASRCAVRLGQLLGRMHAQGVVHRDLKAANLLAVQRSADVAVWLTDLDGVRIGRRARPRRRAADLARLAAGLDAHPWLTPSVVCRFLRAYVAEFPPHGGDWKTLWRQVAPRARRHVRRQQRRGRQVL